MTLQWPWQAEEPTERVVPTYRGIGMALIRQNTVITSLDEEREAIDGLLGGRRVQL